MERARATNAVLAANYDSVAYDPEPEAVLAPASVFGFAGRSVPASADVLDLGCGTGRLLRLVGETIAAGRLVGVDISEFACQRARGYTRRLVDRTTIRQADLLDVTAASLSAFDLIYCVGVLFVTPKLVRQHVISIIRDCLKPNALAVLGYYAGSYPHRRETLFRSLRATVPTVGMRNELVAGARRQLQETAPASPLDAEIIGNALQLSRANFYHEALTENAVLDTREIANTLPGCDFVGYLSTNIRTLDEAARSDHERGGYRHAVFVKR